MMAITHAIISSSVTSLVLGKTDFLTLGLSIIGSQLPDVDSSKSIIGQIFYPISRYLENNFPHRSITHSLLATAIIGVNPRYVRNWTFMSRSVNNSDINE